MAEFLGFVGLGASINVPVLTRNGNVPQDGDGGVAPTYRVYGPAGVMGAGSGSTSLLDSGNITGASNVSPIVITSAGHKLSTGARVTIAGVGGNTAANGTWVVTALDANTFSLVGSTGNGNYTTGGTWHATGLYTATVACTTANGYVSGQTYTFVWNATINSAAAGDVLSFTVV